MQSCLQEITIYPTLLNEHDITTLSKLRSLKSVIMNFHGETFGQRSYIDLIRHLPRSLKRLEMRLL